MGRRHERMGQGFFYDEILLGLRFTIQSRGGWGRARLIGPDIFITGRLLVDRVDLHGTGTGRGGGRHP